MVRIPSLSRRSEPAPTVDANRDGRIDAQDTRDGQLDTTSDARSTTGDTRATDAKSNQTEPVRTEADGADSRPKHRGQSAVAERDATSRPAPPGTTATDIRPDADLHAEPERGLAGGQAPSTEHRPDVVVPAGPRPRASMLATLSLILGVAAAGFVLTGALAGYGIALGTIALLLGVGGVSATARRHVAGKSDALVGMVLGIGAVVIGVLAMTGQFDWPNTDGDTVIRFREWLDSQFVDRF